MKKSLFLIVCLSIWGCASHLVYKPTPSQQISLSDSVQIAGTVNPWGLDFVAVSHVEKDHTRLIVLSALGIKLLDMAVFPQRIEVYVKQEKLPNLVVQAFGRFTRAKLATSCPETNIYYQDTYARAVFQATRQEGGVLCH